MSNPRSTSRTWKVGTGIGLLGVGAGIVVMQHTTLPPSLPVPVAVKSTLDAIVVPGLSLDKEMQIRSDLREALGKVAGVTAQQRLDLLEAVRGTLSPVECDALLHELLEARHPAVPEGWFSVYVQNICLILRDQPAARERYSRVLAVLAKDPSRDAVVRDYAVQHLRQVWDRAAGTPDIRQGIEGTFHDLATGHEPALIATGLLSLHLLGTVQGAGAVPVNGGSLPPGMSGQGMLEKPAYHLPDATLQTMVDAILKAPPSFAAIAPRMTALRIVSDRKLTSSRALIRSLIESQDEHALVRMTAIGTLGILKNPSDRPLLESLDHTDPRIDRAVKSALSSLR